MDVSNIIFLVLISFMVGLVVTMLFVDVNATTIPNNILDEVCSELTNGTHPKFNDDNRLKVSSFNCVTNDVHIIQIG